MSATLNIIETTTELGVEVVEVIVASTSTPGPSGPGVPAGGTDGQVLTKASATDYDTAWEDPTGGAGGGAPVDATYLVTTADVDLTNEVVVGATPGGELGGTWASPTVDATHSGSSHAAVQAAAEATAASALSAHATDTTSIHGIADTSAIALTANHPSNATFNDHSARHENGGADEISLAGLDGTSTALQAHLDDVTDAHDASAVSVLDTGGFYSGSDVEAVLAEIAPQLGAGTGEALQREISQAGHGLAVADVVRHNGSVYVKAQANSAVNAEVVGIVADVPDTDNFVLHYGGRITGLSGLSAGSVYYLDDDTAGLLTTTEPSDAGDISKPLLMADSTTSGYFFNWRGALNVDMATQAELDAHISDSTDAHDASAISVADVAGDYTATDVEGVLAEIAPQLGGGAGTDWEYESRSTNTILGVADKGKAIDITAAITQTFEADETLGDGWYVILKNATDAGTAVVVLNPDGTETIDGLATVTMYSGETRLIMCNGAGGNFNSTLLSGGFARFTADGNFIVPHGITTLQVDCVAGGGAGGGGAGGSAGSVRNGGSGGGGGARTILPVAADALGSPGDTVAVTVAAAATGGTGGSSGVGTAGGNGGPTHFGSLVSAFGGGGGARGNTDGNGLSGGGGGGQTAAGDAAGIATHANGGSNRLGTAIAARNIAMGGGGSGSENGGSIGSTEWGGATGGGTAGLGGGSSVNVAGSKSMHAGGGGGAGGGLGSGNSEVTGSAGGNSRGWDATSGGGGGTAGAVNGGAGGDGTSRPGGAGDGGGGGGTQDSGTGGAGGAGGTPGGGGGGGGGGTTTGGAGGAGGRGECRVWYS